MAESTIWWVLAGSVVAVELVTGTFYLLMLSLGLVAAAISAHAGATTPVQILVAAVFGGGSVVLWRVF
ncbi:MAG: NfeD family protein, partial [Rhodoferax sp.]|nr:NfeD family protein [Rhodoferax sp.]